jgi:pimeloyl-ACP methyl ester carboxylesterase
LKRSFIDDNYLNVHVTEWGDKKSPLIFCLHGLGSTGLSFIEVAEQLKDKYRVISIDAPGHGKTPPFDNPEQYEMPNIITWINNILDYLNIENFYFLSHSWGSFVALFYLMNYPERVDGTILIDGGYQSKRRSQQTMEEEVAYYEKDFEEYVETWDEFRDVVKGDSDRWNSYRELYANDLLLRKDDKFYWHARGITAGHIIKAMYKHEIEDIYEKLPSNILLLRATLPEKLDEQRNMTCGIFQQKTGAKVKLVPNTTHLLHWDNPDIVVEEIKKNWAISS